MNSIEGFAQSIQNNLTQNGFPLKKVSLPTEKMYEVADNKDISLNQTLDYMREHFDIDSEITDEKIIFTSTVAGEPDMMQKAQEMMANMDPQEMQRIQEMIMNMSDNEKADLMQKGREMGLI